MSAQRISRNSFPGMNKPSDRNIVLTGFMGTGKTAVGRELAASLRRELIDIDAEIEKSQGMTISEIFSRFGEPGFRDIEAETIRTIASTQSSCVISTGGGAVIRQENIDALKQNGVIVCLTAEPETILKRTAGNKDRPLLQVKDPLTRIREMLDFRMKYYEKADIMIDTDDKSPLQIAGEIMKKTGLRR